NRNGKVCSPCGSDWKDRHPFPRFETLAVGRNDQQAIRLRERGNISRSVPAQQLDFRIEPRSENLSRQKPSQSHFGLHIFCQAHLPPLRCLFKCAGQSPHEDATEQLERDHCRDRIAWQPEEVDPAVQTRSRPRPSEHKRLSRLNLHSSEEKLGAKVSQCVFHQVVFPSRDASTQQQQIVSQSHRDQFPQTLRFIWSYGELHRFPTSP